MHERPWLVATRVTLLIVGLLVGVLVITGIMLAFGYRPDAAAFTTVQRISSHSHTRTIHRVSSQALLPAFGCLAISATGLALVRHRAWRLVPIAVGGIGLVAASVTGYLLPWNQLFLNEVTVGTNISGYGRILFGSDVKSVIVGRTMVEPGTLARWFWVHVVVTTLIIVVSLVIIARHARAETRDPESRRSASSDEAVRTP